VQDVKDVMQRLIDARDGVEESVIQAVVFHQRRRLHSATGGYCEYSLLQKLV